MTEEKIKEVLSKIKEPVLNLDYVTLNFIRDISLNGKNLSLTLEISNLDNNIIKVATQNVKRQFQQLIPELEKVNVDFILGVVEHKNAKKTSVIAEVKNTIAISL